MGLVYSFGYLIPFLILLKILYLKEFKDERLAIALWGFHVFFTIFGGKLVYILFHDKDLMAFFSPYGYMGIGIVLFAYFYLFMIGMIFKKDPIRLWDKLSLLAPLGIFIIRLGNILNKEVEGLINYATIEIVSSLLMMVLLYKYEFLRKNITLFVFFFYYATRLLITEPIRGVKFFSVNYAYAILFAIICLSTYFFVYKLRKKALFS